MAILDQKGIEDFCGKGKPSVSALKDDNIRRFGEALYPSEEKLRQFAAECGSESSTEQEIKNWIHWVKNHIGVSEA